MHEIIEMFPCETPVLCEHHAEVGTLLRTSAISLYSILYRLNVKLGGVNAVPEPRDVSFLTDSANPTIVIGKHHLAAWYKGNDPIYFILIRCRCYPPRTWLERPALLYCSRGKYRR
jgi:hypothetical protein